MTRPPSPRRMADLPYSQRAGILCNDPGFQRFAAAQISIAPRLSPSATAEYLRGQCGVSSRAHLDTSAQAQAAFDRLTTSYDAWRGKIPAPR